MNVVGRRLFGPGNLGNGRFVVLHQKHSGTLRVLRPEALNSGHQRAVLLGADERLLGRRPVRRQLERQRVRVVDGDLTLPPARLLAQQVLCR